MDNTVRKRRRPAVACIECRRRKVKCDRAFPCKSCVLGASLCTYDGSLGSGARDPVHPKVLSLGPADAQHLVQRRASEHEQTHGASSAPRNRDHLDLPASADGFGSGPSQETLMASLTGPSLGDVQTSSVSGSARTRYFARDSWRGSFVKVVNDSSAMPHRTNYL
jgi:hypothetical protein